jgi:hypothetical protein
MASAFASAFSDVLMPLPSREAAAHLGQRQSRSLPHTLPGVWFVPFGTVPAVAGQATPGLASLGVRRTGYPFEAAACAAGYRTRLYSLAPGFARPLGPACVGSTQAVPPSQACLRQYWSMGMLGIAYAERSLKGAIERHLAPQGCAAPSVSFLTKCFSAPHPRGLVRGSESGNFSASLPRDLDHPHGLHFVQASQSFPKGMGCRSPPVSIECFPKIKGV